MGEYIFTRKGYEVLADLIRKTEERLEKTIKAKTEAGSGQDGWHDEGFKRGTEEEMMWSKRLGELQNIYANAQIVDPKEQNDIVSLGTGVVLEYENGDIFNLILEGFAIELLEGRVSIHSPLGKTILGAREGEKRTFEIGGSKKTITIKKILPPSVAENIFLEKKIEDASNEK